jgi:hypothetical protein
MYWEKIGNIFAPENNFTWMISHAANPFAEHLKFGLYRIYFTCRDSKNRSHIGSVDIDFDNNYKVEDILDSPVLAPGEPGMFDDSGVAMGYLIEINGKKMLYYLGWNLKVTVPWLNTIGLAVFNKATNSFDKVSRAPLLDRSDEDPFSISYPSILSDQGIYKMWYGSNIKWGNDQSEMNHVIKYAESKDGIQWKRNHKVALDLVHENEYALSKPFVLKENGEYKMWYSYRGRGVISTYRIGYAESNDGVVWSRKDEKVGIDVSKNSWDSDMISYPFIFDHRGESLMLYNGNGYGKTGFGLAKLIDN